LARGANEKLTVAAAKDPDPGPSFLLEPD
jgi:hypothetical protein